MTTDMLRDLRAVLIIVVTAVLVLCSGCAAAPAHSVPIAPTIKPTATAAPTISAKDVDELKVAVRQVQKTATDIETHVRTSYALDAERAKLAAQKQRDARLDAASERAMWLGFVLLMIVFPAPASDKLNAIILILAVCLVAGSAGVPMLWPF